MVKICYFFIKVKSTRDLGKSKWDECGNCLTMQLNLGPRSVLEHLNEDRNGTLGGTYSQLIRLDLASSTG